MNTHGIRPIDLFGGQPLSVRSDRGEGRRIRRLHREYRHRRAGDDPRRRQESRRRRGGGRAGGLPGLARRTFSKQRFDDTWAPQKTGRQGLCAHRQLRRGDLQLVRQRTRRSGTVVPCLRRQARRGPALWREPAPKRGVLSHARAAAGVATARQVQGKQLSYNNINDTDAAYECVAGSIPTAPRGRHHQARQPGGVAEAGNIVEAYRKALACDQPRRSAASLR